MSGKVFDAAVRVLLCGAAVILLTALAIPELIELGVEKEAAEETVAPWLSFFIVLLLYTLFASSRRVRRDTLTAAEKKKVTRNIFWQGLLTPIAVALILIPVLHLTNVPAWLHAALTAALTVMAVVAAIEWQLFKREHSR